MKIEFFKQWGRHIMVADSTVVAEFNWMWASRNRAGWETNVLVHGCTHTRFFLLLREAKEWAIEEYKRLTVPVRAA